MRVTYLVAAVLILGCTGGCSRTADTARAPASPDRHDLVARALSDEVVDAKAADLDSRALLDAELRDKFDKLADWLDFCRRITVKELTGQNVLEEGTARLTKTIAIDIIGCRPGRSGSSK